MPVWIFLAGFYDVGRPVLNLSPSIWWNLYTRSWKEKADLHTRTWKKKADYMQGHGRRHLTTYKGMREEIWFTYKDKERESCCLLPAVLTLKGRSYRWVIPSLALESTFSGFQHTVKDFSSLVTPEALSLLMENSHCWTFRTTVSKSP